MRGIRSSAGDKPGRRAAPGFTLIEVLIVVAIILVIMAIAIPNFMRSRMTANEAAAVANLRDITTAAVAYSSTWGNGYPPTLGSLGGPDGMISPTCNQALLLDSVLTNSGSGNTSTKSGYIYTYIPGTPLAAAPPGCSNPGVQSFQIVAVPQVISSSGQRGFFTDQSGVIRYTTDGSAPTINSTPIQ